MPVIVVDEVVPDDSDEGKVMPDEVLTDEIMFDSDKVMPGKLLSNEIRFDVEVSKISYITC